MDLAQNIESSNSAATPGRQTGPRVCAFTLIELMVVVTIILILIGILIAGYSVFAQHANRSATQQFMNTIALGLQSYERDFGAYPPSGFPNPVATNRWFGITESNLTAVTAWTGAELMTQALVGPQGRPGGNPPFAAGVLTGLYDGVNGYGYRPNVDPTTSDWVGRIYGPYLRIRNDNTLVASSTRWYLTMASSPGRKPFCYYRANGGGTTLDTNIWAAGGRFLPADNAALVTGAETYMTVVQTAQRASLSVAMRAAPFILSFPGSDDTFGTIDDNTYPSP